MCGIIGYVGKGDCVNVVLDGLKKMEYRGYDSAGLALTDESGITVVKAKGRIVALEEKAKELREKLTPIAGIGHTRWATHGEPNDRNSHPHSGEQASVIHNGIIENYMPIKEKLIDKGFTFESETDTEVMAKLLDFYYNGNPFETIAKALKDVRGAYAFGIVFKDFPNKVFGARKESPLIVAYGEGENFLASDISAILKYTRNYSLIEEGEIVEIDKDQILIRDLEGNKIEKEVLTATWDLEAAEKGGFPHFMLKEIHEQPESILKTIRPRIENGLPSLGLEGLTPEDLKKFNHIYIVACGTAMYAGLVGKSLIEELARVPVTVEIASEFRYKNPILRKDDLVVFVSQSGETADTLAALRLVKKAGITTMAIANVVGSTISREADHVLYTWAGPEISVASTKAYTVQVSMLYLLAFQLALVQGTKTEDEVKNLVNTLLSLPEKITSLLEKAEEYKDLAKNFIHVKDLFYLGRTLDYALAQEGSLKLKEISYVHSEAYAAGELKHGTISLIEEGIPVISLGTQDALYEKSISNVREVKARGANVVFVCKEGSPNASEIGDYLIEIPRVDDLFTPLLTVVPMQLFAYFMAVLRGCDVDKPRNLAKSVTVE